VNFAAREKNIQTQLAQYGFRLDAEHGGELPQGIAADVLGMGFEDFGHNEFGFNRGSPEVATVWELHSCKPSPTNPVPCAMLHSRGSANRIMLMLSRRNLRLAVPFRSLSIYSSSSNPMLMQMKRI
jgi:hypothetical protein